MWYSSPMTSQRDVELDLDGIRELISEHQEAVRSSKQWAEHVQELASRIKEAMGEATVGKVDGKTVVTFRNKDSFASARFVKDHPDLSKHYMKTKVVEELDVGLLRMVQPDLCADYQVRELRNNWGK